MRDGLRLQMRSRSGSKPRREIDLGSGRRVQGAQALVETDI
jgi:hypothetical protein